MGFIKIWALSISGFLILATIAEMLLPNDGIKKYAKLVLGLMLIVLVIKPILNLPSLDIMQNSFTLEYEEAKTPGQLETVRETFEKRLATDMQAKLKPNFGDLNIDVEIGIDESKAFFIDSVTVSNSNEKSRKEIANELIKNYGCDEIRFT